MKDRQEGFICYFLSPRLSFFLLQFFFFPFYLILQSVSFQKKRSAYHLDHKPNLDSRRFRPWLSFAANSFSSFLKTFVFSKNFLSFICRSFFLLLLLFLFSLSFFFSSGLKCSLIFSFFFFCRYLSSSLCGSRQRAHQFFSSIACDDCLVCHGNDCNTDVDSHAIGAQHPQEAKQGDEVTNTNTRGVARLPLNVFDISDIGRR